MKSLAHVSLALACLTARIAGAADTVKTVEALKREARMAANSNEVASPTPQLSANPNAGPEVPMARETNRPVPPSAAPVEVGTPLAAQPRSSWRVIPAVLAVVAGSFLLKRRRSRSGPS